MKSIYKLLDVNFDTFKRSEIISILKEYDLLGMLENAFRLLYRQNNKPGDIVTILSALLLGIERKIEAIKKLKYTRKKLESISSFMFIFLADFLIKTQHEPKEIISHLKENLHIFNNLLCQRSGSALKLFDFEKLAFICSTRTTATAGTARAPHPATPYPQENAPGIKQNAPPAPVAKRFIWTNKGKLEELVHQLVKRKLIKQKSGFFNLFLKPDDNLLIKWDTERIPELSFLLFKLYSLGFLKISGNKGYFTLAEKHFCGINGTVIKRNSLKKLSSSIRNENEKYSSVITEVNAIIRSIHPAD